MFHNLNDFTDILRVEGMAFAFRLWDTSTKRTGRSDNRSWRTVQWLDGFHLVVMIQ
jgi:hypothetical protein